MELSEKILLLHEHRPKAFGTCELIDLSLELGGRLAESEPTTPETDGRYESEILGAAIARTAAACRACGRCERRTQVIPSEGTYGAKIFILCDSPSWADDRSGFPLSAWPQIKNGRCRNCESFGPCYENYARPDPDTIAPSFPCKPRAEKNAEQLRANWDRSQPLYRAGKIFDLALRSVGAGRLSDHLYREARANAGLSETTPDLPNEIFITHLVRCWDRADDGMDRDPTGPEVSACWSWFTLEHKLCGAPVTLALGPWSTAYLLGIAVADTTPWFGKSRVIPEWGEVFCEMDPKHIARFGVESDVFKQHLTRFKATFKAAFARAEKLRRPITKPAETALALEEDDS